MASPILEEAYYRVDILQKIVTEEMMIRNPLINPLEACLIDSSRDEIKEY